VIEFFEAVATSGPLKSALLAGIAASLSCGIVGSLVTARRITSIAGGVAHATLGGMGAARYAAVVFGWTAIHPMHGAAAAALASALVIGWVSLRARQREDTVISAVWAIGMGVGVLFIARTPGYGEDLMSYLFGNILMVSRGELIAMAALDLVVLLLTVLFYHKFLAICFDEEFARIRGVHVEFYYLLLMCMTALTIVVLVCVVGLIMAIALLTLPAAIAMRFTFKLWKVMAAAALLSAALTVAGLAISYEPELPPGAVTVVLAGVVYVAVMAASSRRSQTAA
jgi:zinc transport system permease protein